MKLNVLLNERKEKSIKEIASIDTVKLDHEALASIVVKEKEDTIRKLIKDRIKSLVSEEKDAASKTLREIVDRVVNNRVKGIKDAEELTKAKKKILEEAANPNSKLFKKIKEELTRKIQNDFSNSRIRRSISGSISRIAGNKFENIVRKQIIEERDYPVKGLSTFIKNFFRRTYNIDFDLDAFKVVKSKSTDASFDLQIVYRNESFMNFHCKFLGSEKTKEGMGAKKVQFKTADFNRILPAAQKLVGKDAEGYFSVSKNPKGFKTYNLKVYDLLSDTSLKKLNQNIESVRDLLRIGFDSSFILVLGERPRVSTIYNITGIEKEGREYLLTNKDGEVIMKINKRGRLEIGKR